MTDMIYTATANKSKSITFPFIYRNIIIIAIDILHGIIHHVATILFIIKKAQCEVIETLVMLMEKTFEAVHFFQSSRFLLAKL